MNVLVTGAAEFLAPHVAAVFREAGHACRLIDLRPGEGSEYSSAVTVEDALPELANWYRSEGKAHG